MISFQDFLICFVNLKLKSFFNDVSELFLTDFEFESRPWSSDAEELFESGFPLAHKSTVTFHVFATCFNALFHYALYVLLCTNSEQQNPDFVPVLPRRRKMSEPILTQPFRSHGKSQPGSRPRNSTF